MKIPIHGIKIIIIGIFYFVLHSKGIFNDILDFNYI